MEDGGGWAVLLQQCHPNSAGSLVIAGGTEWGPHCFCCFFVLSATPKLGETPRYIDRINNHSLFLFSFVAVTKEVWADFKDQLFKRKHTS